MSRISYCWELGGGYGHLTSFKPLADTLNSRGHTVTAFIRETKHASKFFDRNEVEYFEAPAYKAATKDNSVTVSYADILKRCGYSSTQSILSFVEQWRKKFQQSDTELIIADHSPTALIAARSLNIPATLFGTGFYAPPSIYPMPTITPWVNTNNTLLCEIEDEVVEIINNVLRHYNSKPLDYLYQLFDVEENFLCTLPELDHYEGREPDVYWGPQYSDDSGIDAADVSSAWLNDTERKVFIYTNSNYKYKDNLLSSLSSINADFLVHCANISNKEIEEYSATNVTFSIAPVSIKSIKNTADLVVCHSGHGMVAASLMLGIPLFLIPTQLEQAILAEKLKFYKFADLVKIPDSAPDFVSKIHGVLDNSVYKEQAVKFSKHYGGFNQQYLCEEVALACEGIVV